MQFKEQIPKRELDKCTDELQESVQYIRLVMKSLEAKDPRTVLKDFEEFTPVLEDVER